MSGFNLILWTCFVICINTAFSVFGCAINVSYFILLTANVLFVIVFVISLNAWRKLFNYFWMGFFIIPAIGLTITLLNKLGVFSNLYNDEDVKLKKYFGFHEYDRGTMNFLIWSNVFLIGFMSFHLIVFHKKILKITDSYFSLINESRSNPTSPLRNETSIFDYDLLVRAEHMSAIYFEKLSVMMLDPTKQESDIASDIWNMAYHFFDKTFIVLMGFMSTYNVCLIHFGFLVFSIFTVYTTQFTRVTFNCIMMCAVAAVFVTRLVYYMPFFEHDSYNLNRQNLNATGNISKWFGYSKTNFNDYESIIILILPLVILGVAVLFKLLYVKQAITFGRLTKNKVYITPNMRYLVIPFPRITHKEIDNGFDYFLKFLINYGFYRIGLELIAIWYTVLISLRMDSYAFLYSWIVMALVFLSRTCLSRVWKYLKIAMAISIVSQYALAITVSFDIYIDWQNDDMNCWNCLLYWSITTLKRENQQFLKLFGDFCVYILLSDQTHIFRVERSVKDERDFPGGSNECTSTRGQMENPNYVPSVYDFVEKKKTMLDILKHLLLYSHIWFVVMVSFVVIFYGIDVFSFGYLIFSFTLLWPVKENFYANTMEVILKKWNILLLYNITVLLTKNIIQLPSCLISPGSFYYVLLRTVGIANCAERIKDNVFAMDHYYYNYNYGDEQMQRVRRNESVCCPIALDVFFDCIYFVFLILQRAVFCTEYIVRIIDEAKTLELLKSRGTELKVILESERIKREDESEKEKFNMTEDLINQLETVKGVLSGGKYNAPIDQRDSLLSGDYYMCLENELLHYFLTPVPQISEPSSSLSVLKVRDKITSNDIASDYFSSHLTRLHNSFLNENSTTSDERKTKPHSTTTSATIEDTATKKRTPFKMLLFTLNEMEIYLADTIARFAEFIKKIMISDLRIIRTIRNDKRLIKQTLNLRLPIDVLREINLNLPLQPAPFNDVKQDSSIDRKRCRLTTCITELCNLLYIAYKFNADIITYALLFTYSARESDLMVFALPLLILYWGVLSIPRPVKTFWITIMRYVQILVLVKLFMQLDIVYSYCILTSSDSVTIKRTLNYVGYRKYQTVDRIYLFLLAVHTLLLRLCLESTGFWTVEVTRSTVDTYAEETTGIVVPSDGSWLMNYFLYLLRKVSFKKQRQQIEERCRTSTTYEAKFMKLMSKLKDGSVIHVIGAPTMYSENRLKITLLFCKAKDHINKLNNNENRFPRDIYVYTFACEALSISILMAGFEQFVPVENELLRKLLRPYAFHNLYRVPLVFSVFFTVMILAIIADRIVYVYRNALVKIIIYLSLIGAIHVYIFVYLPWVRPSESGSFQVPQLWYLTKCLCFLMSAYVLRHGYPSAINKTRYTNTFSIFHGLLYDLFRNSPILYQVATMLDWCGAETTLNKKNWECLRTLLAENYIRKCYLGFCSYWSHPSGTRVPYFRKVCGLLFFITLFVIIFFPMYFYGFLTYTHNRPISFHFRIDLIPVGRLYEVNVMISDVDVLTASQWSEFKRAYIKTHRSGAEISTYNRKDVTRIKLPSLPQGPFVIDINTLYHLKRSSSSTLVEVRSTWSIKRKITNTDTKTVANGEHSTFISSYVLQSAMDALLVTSDTEFYIPTVIPKFIVAGKYDTTEYLRLPSIEKYDDELEFGGVRCTAVSRFKTDMEIGATWKLEESNPNNFVKRILYTAMLKFAPFNSSDFINIFVFSDKTYNPGIAEYVAKYGFVKLYLFLISAFFYSSQLYWERTWYSGLWFRKVLNLDRILELFRNIELSRYYNRRIYEEYFFATLLFLYRSPDAFMRWTVIPQLKKDIH